MRLLQLVTGTDELLDLHPHVTIAQGLDSGLRGRLIDAVVGLSQGRAAGEGLLEAHGVLFPLDQTHLDELELRGLDVDPIVRRADLPGQRGAVDTQELAVQQEVFAALLDRIGQRAEEQSRARDDLAASASALDQARGALEEAKAGSTAGAGGDPAAVATQLAGRRRHIEERLLDEWAEQEEAAAARAALETQLAQLQEAVEVAAARTMSAVEALERLDDPAESDLLELPSEAELAGEATDRAAEVDARLAALDNRLAVLGRGDIAQLEEAQDLLRAGAMMVPSAVARSLADEIEALDARIGDQEVAEASAAAIANARARLEDARQALLEAEQAARSPVLSHRDVDELEQAHDALLDAIERAEGRFSGGRAHRRVEEGRAAEQEVLDRLGFRSYADYVMGGSTREANPALDQALTSARVELQAAEDEWRELEALAEEELARAALLDARRETSERATSLLGRRVDRSDEPEALRDLRVPAVATSEAIDAVRSALEGAGIELAEEELDVEELTALTTAAAEAARDGEDRRLQLVEERAALDGERRRLAEPDGDRAGMADLRLVPDPDRDGRRTALPVELQAELEAELEAELASARELERAAVEACDAVRAELAAAVAAEGAVADLVRSSEAELAGVATLPDAPVEPEGRLEELAAVVEQAELEHQRALQRVEAEDRELAVLDEEGRSLAAQIERQAELVAVHDEGATTTTDELEWYLLARIAAQRSVSVAGSLPLVLLDDALGLVDPAEGRRLLDRLERMADAVQVIVVSDDPELVSWVDAVGPARAAVVRVTAA